MADRVRDVRMVTTPLASVARDHYPVVVTIRADDAPAPTTRPTTERFEP